MSWESYPDDMVAVTDLPIFKKLAKYAKGGINEEPTDMIERESVLWDKVAGPMRYDGVLAIVEELDRIWRGHVSSKKSITPPPSPAAASSKISPTKKCCTQMDLTEWAGTLTCKNCGLAHHVITRMSYEHGTHVGHSLTDDPVQRALDIISRRSDHPITLQVAIPLQQLLVARIVNGHMSVDTVTKYPYGDALRCVQPNEQPGEQFLIFVTHAQDWGDGVRKPCILERQVREAHARWRYRQSSQSCKVGVTRSPCRQLQRTPR